MRNAALLAAVICTSLAAAASGEPRGLAVESASLTIRPEETVRPLSPQLFGVNVSVGDAALLSDPGTLERVRRMGFTSFRFPNGCQADLYDWKSPRPGWVTVQQFLDFCDALGGEAYYTLNLQGGTEGLQGPPPPDAALDERIRYRHTAPNPCGNTDYHFGTLEEALELFRVNTIQRALEGKRPVLHYEMGNENWGQAFTDWPPDVYARTVEVYARALREELAAAQKRHPGLAGLKLYIVAVGFPVMGNNMQPVDTPDRRTNIAWTRALNELAGAGVIDAVQEHFYPYASANGGSLAWAAHNLENILDARLGRANPRLAGYLDPPLAYRMPLEFTEWNIRCWGPQLRKLAELQNGSFESGLDGWTVRGGSAAASLRAARRGGRGLRVDLRRGEGPVEVVQEFAVPEGTISLTAAVWARSSRAGAVRVELRKPGGDVFGGFASVAEGRWERLLAGGRLPEGLRRAGLALIIEGPGVAYLDEAAVYFTDVERGHGAMSAVTFEQALFAVDALRAMASAGCPRAHLHHIIGDYPCGAMTTRLELKEAGRAFEFWNGMYGDRIVGSALRTPVFRYASAGNAWATHFNALAPDRDDVPVVAALASRTESDLFVLLLNRSTDRDVDVDVDLGADPAESTALRRTLHGPDLDLPGAHIREDRIPAARRMAVRAGPCSAQILRVSLRPE